MRRPAPEHPDNDTSIYSLYPLSGHPGRSQQIRSTMQPTRPLAFFVAGTDTDAGKTTVSAGLLAAARHHGLSTLAGKPVASGSQQTPEGLRNPDALQLASQCSIQVPYQSLNPYAFMPAIAPHLAAASAGIRLDCSGLQQAVRQLLARDADLTLIEGAGGWRVPINEQETLADLAIALQLPVILVVGMQLGCINHALLSTEAILRDGLMLAGWVANCTDPHMLNQADNLHTLQQWMPAPCLAVIPYLPSTQPDALVTHLEPALAHLYTSSSLCAGAYPEENP